MKSYIINLSNCENIEFDKKPKGANCILDIMTENSGLTRFVCLKHINFYYK